MLKNRIIYAGDTPLFSDFTVTQTGPMQLTISGGDFWITGQARIVDKHKVPSDFFDDGRAERMPDGKRVRVWLQDKQTKQIMDKSKRRKIVGQTVVNITSHPTKTKEYRIDLESPTDIVMQIKIKSWLENQPVDKYGPNYTHFIVLPFTIPAGTTDLSGIDIEVFTVLPGFPPSTPEWEV